MTALPRRAPAEPAEPSAPAARTDDGRLLDAVLAGLLADEPEACTGELLVHADGRTECLGDPACTTDPALHLGVVRCAADLADGCCAERARA